MQLGGIGGRFDVDLGTENDVLIQTLDGEELALLGGALDGDDLATLLSALDGDDLASPRWIDDQKSSSLSVMVPIEIGSPAAVISSSVQFKFQPRMSTSLTTSSSNQLPPLPSIF